MECILPWEVLQLKYLERFRTEKIQASTDLDIFWFQLEIFGNQCRSAFKQTFSANRIVNLPLVALKTDANFVFIPIK